MKHFKVAKRYSKALLQLGVEKNQLDQLFADANEMVKIQHNHHELYENLKSPLVTSTKKLSILENVFAKFISPLMMDFVKVISQNKREDILLEVLEDFVHEYRKYNKILRVKVITPSALTKALETEILEKFKPLNYNKIELERQVDTNLIGGFILQYNNKQIDTSIKSRLVEAKHELSKNLYIKQL